MHSYVQFITTPTVDTPGTTLLLHFDDKRYYFGNVAEGVQRASVERGVRLGKLSDIFLTGRTEWANTGGLIGMILSLADLVTSSETQKIQQRSTKKRIKRHSGQGDGDSVSGALDRSMGDLATNRSLTIHGGDNLTHTLATARRFVFRKGMPVAINEFNSKLEAENDLAPTWGDKNINVWAMSISPDGVRDLKHRHSSGPGSKSAAEEKTSSISVLSDAHQERDKKIREAVVSEMFRSDWRFDSLVEIPLAHVKMPASIFIRNSETGHIEKYDGPLPGSGVALPDITVLVRKPWPGALIDLLPPTSPSSIALSYIVRNHPQRGRFDPVKAEKLKVKKGRNYMQLTMGQNVEALDGTIVTPDMVLGPGKEGGGFAVVELPSITYIRGLIERPEWGSQEVMKGVGAIIWILGDGVIQDSGLRNFIDTMGHLKHIVSSRDHCHNYLAFDSAASAAIRLNQIHSAAFPIPDHDNITLPQYRSEPSSGSAKPPLSLRSAQRGLIIQLEPAVELLDHSIVPPLNSALVIQNTPQGVLQLARNADRNLKSWKDAQDLSKNQYSLAGKDAEIITLGTGSASPSKNRNVSATLLRVPGIGSYLFDCGENTLGQLRRVYPASQLKEVLQDLRLIWISHLHADHHLGTVSVIKAWYQEVHQATPPSKSKCSTQEDVVTTLTQDQRLFVVSSAGMIDWLAEYSAVEDFGYERLIPLTIGSADPCQGVGSTLTWGDTPVGFRSENHAINSAMMGATGLSDIQAVTVDHCVGAKAVSITFASGFKFSYSGDCRPSKKFSRIGKLSTVLLHEATFEDELQGDALAKKHSTTSEALGVGFAMKARRIILTHFSQRYSKIPVMNETEREEITLNHRENLNTVNAGAFVNPSAENTKHQSTIIDRDEIMKDEDNFFRKVYGQDVKVAVAFDYMRVKVGEIAHLEHFTPALMELFETTSPKDEAMSDDNNEPRKAAEGRESKQHQHGKRKGSSEGKQRKTNRRPSDGQ